MTAVAEKTVDYTTCGVPGASWSTENIPGTSSGNATNRECNLKLVFEKPIFSEKFGGFENYTCPRFTLVNPNALEIFFGHHCIGLLFDLGHFILHMKRGAKHSPPGSHPGPKMMKNHIS